MMIPTTRRTPTHFRGCLLGGAVGDALGAPVEHLSLYKIRAVFGPEGIADFTEAHGRPLGAITDDTQMTLFTAEGLLRAHHRQRIRGSGDLANVVHRAYLRWLHTQGVELPVSVAPSPSTGGSFASRNSTPSAPRGGPASPPCRVAEWGPSRPRSTRARGAAG